MGAPKVLKGVYRLAFRGEELLLGDAPVVVGRSPDCHVMIRKDKLASRRHARFTATPEGVRVEDLGSTNGVYVEGERITRPAMLTGGEHVRVGQQEFKVLASDTRRKFFKPSSKVDSWSDKTALPLGAEPEEGSDRTHRADVFDVLLNLSEKALREKNPEGAERIIGPQLTKLARQAAASRTINAAYRERGALIALQLAQVTGQGRWVDLVISLYAATGDLVTPSVIDALEAAARKVDQVDVTSLRRYAVTAASPQRPGGPGEKHIAARVRALEQPIAR